MTVPQPPQGLLARRPAESITASIATPTGAVLVILGAYGVTIPQEVSGAIVGLVGWIATVVTYIVEHSRSRSPPPQ